MIFVLIAILLPWGAPGVSLGLVAGQFVSWPIAMLYVRRVSGIPIREQLRPGQAALISTLIMVAAVVPFRWLIDGRLSPLASLAACSALGAIIYATSMSLIGRPQVASVLRNFKALRTGTNAVREAAGSR